MTQSNTPNSWDEAVDEILSVLADKAIMARVAYRRDRNNTKMSANIKRAENQAKSALNKAVSEHHPYAEILVSQGVTRCDECNDFMNTDDECLCEACDKVFHEGCAGYTYDGEGEYPSESAYALCKEHGNDKQRRIIGDK